eukprot:6127564-Amphidinium_carterae.2
MRGATSELSEVTGCGSSSGALPRAAGSGLGGAGCSGWSTSLPKAQVLGGLEAVLATSDCVLESSLGWAAGKSSSTGLRVLKPSWSSWGMCSERGRREVWYRTSVVEAVWEGTACCCVGLKQAGRSLIGTLTVAPLRSL